ncbi:MAG: hypothetical protein ACOC5D_01210 [Thermoplasmatota archaeon]
MKELTKKLIVRLTAYAFIIVSLIYLLYAYPKYQIYYPLNLLSISFLITCFMGLFLRYLGANLLKYENLEKFQPALISIGYFSIGIGFYFLIELFDPPVFYELYMHIIKILSFIILIAFSTLSITNLFAYGEYLKDFKVSNFLESVVNSQKIIVVIVTLFFLYLQYIRSPLQNKIEHIRYLDWGLFVFFSILIVREFYIDIKGRVDYNENYDFGEKHQQMIEQLEDKKLKSLEMLQKRFVETGMKEYLLTYLIQLLANQSNRFTPGRTGRILKPLIYYRDRPVPKHSFEWWKERIKKKNEENRKRVLEEITEDIHKNLDIKISDLKQRRR